MASKAVEDDLNKFANACGKWVWDGPSRGVDFRNSHKRKMTEGHDNPWGDLATKHLEETLSTIDWYPDT